MATPVDLALRRRQLGSLPAAPTAPDVTVTRSDLGGVVCLVCEPALVTCTIVHFHGGGFRLGSAQGSSSLATRIAAAASAKVITVDYRLAPEHPFPAALHDAVAVYDAARDDAAGLPVLAAGESAGGGVAATLSVSCWRSARPPLDGLILMSPWLDLRCVAASYRRQADTDHLFSREAATEAAEMYLQGHPAADELASPLLAPAAAFPRTFVTASRSEVLIDESIDFARKLRRSRLAVTSSFRVDLPHAWPATAPDAADTALTLDELGRFVRGLG